jgi:hypothetical protein
MRINLIVAGAHAIQPHTNVKADGTFTNENVSADRYSLRVFNNPDGTYLKAARTGDRRDGAERSTTVGRGGIVDGDSGPSQSEAGGSL